MFFLRGRKSLDLIKFWFAPTEMCSRAWMTSLRCLCRLVLQPLPMCFFSRFSQDITERWACSFTTLGGSYRGK
uniref:Uncharacterized protein n=1 Tax=Arundo donax TaxID=35708 RepID=A0A0A9QS45_ARUDO